MVFAGDAQVYAHYYYSTIVVNLAIIYHCNRGETELYEDDGNTTQYMGDKYAKTVVSFGRESAM